MAASAPSSSSDRDEELSAFWLPFERFFPLTKQADVADLVREVMRSPNPCLAFVSVVLGFWENHHTQNDPKQRRLPLPTPLPGIPALSSAGASTAPFSIKWSDITTLMEQLVDFIRPLSGRLDAVSRSTDSGEGGTPRSAIKMVCDAVWSSVSKAYFKDRPHIQSVYSFLKSKQHLCTLATVDTQGHFVVSFFLFFFFFFCVNVFSCRFTCKAMQDFFCVSC